MITANDEDLIPNGMVAKGRDLVITAVKLINGYMSYLRRASSKSDVSEPFAEYACPDEHHPESSDDITNNQ